MRGVAAIIRERGRGEKFDNRVGGMFFSGRKIVPKLCPTGRDRTIPNVTERDAQFRQALRWFMRAGLLKATYSEENMVRLEILTPDSGSQSDSVPQAKQRQPAK
jgi:hypothetical protein